MTNAPRKPFSIRWLTVGEIVGVVAVIVAVLGYWDSHRERQAQDQARQAEAAQAAQKDAFVLTGALNGDASTLRLTPLHSEQAVQTQTLWFPTVVRPDSRQTTGDARIEAGWIAGGARKAANKDGEGRIPVVIETSFIEDGDTKTDRSFYELAFNVRSKFPFGERVSLEGLSLLRRGVAGDPQAAVDRTFAAQHAG